MKLVSDEEKDAHIKFTAKEGAKGALLGLGLSYGLVTFLRKRHPASYKNFSSSIKGALWTMPTAATTAFFADQGGVKFDQMLYRSGYLEKEKKEEKQNFEQLSLADQLLTKINKNKYSIIVGLWGVSLYGSWKIANKDKYMSTAQKAVQARVYAQAVTVILLLGTILLSVHENEILKKQGPPVPEWKKVLESKHLLEEKEDNRKDNI